MIEVVKVANKEDGNDKANEILKNIVDGQTLLVVSGGTSPDYNRILVTPGNILPGAVCIGDERYGQPFHKDSNELVLQNSGLIDYLKLRNIEFHKMLTGEAASIVAQNYNEVVEGLLSKFLKKVGIMGVGRDLHTSGIFPNSKATKVMSNVVDDVVPGPFPHRITMTLAALEKINFFVVLIFGEEKREAVKMMLDSNQNDVINYPAIFYRKSMSHSYLVTDVAP